MFKVVLIKDQFIKTAALVMQVISPRPSLPVLGNFLLDAQRGRLEIVGTDLETTIHHRLSAKVLGDGKITAPAKILVDFCQAVSGDNVTLELRKDTLSAKGGQAEASFPTMSEREYPDIAKFEPQGKIEIEAQELLEAIAQIAFSAAPEEGRPILTGVLLRVDKGSGEMVATDGYRLAKKGLELQGKIDVLVPARVLREAARILTDKEGTKVEIASNLENNQVRLKSTDSTITTRLLDGDYPNYEQIIPTSYVAETRLNSKEFSDAVKLAALFAKDIGNVARLSTEEGQLIVAASTASVGEATTKVAAKNSGERLKAAFNSRFLIEAAGSIKSSEIRISFSGSTSAALLRGDKDNNLTHVVMPVRTTSVDD
ncbi:MAG: DNA polymerase III subunit beta [Candidatus Woykebacteria bacterium]